MMEGVGVAFTSSTPSLIPGVSRTSKGVRIASGKRDGSAENCKTTLISSFSLLSLSKDALYEEIGSIFRTLQRPVPMSLYLGQLRSSLWVGRLWLRFLFTGTGQGPGQ